MTKDELVQALRAFNQEATWLVELDERYEPLAIQLITKLNKFTPMPAAVAIGVALGVAYAKQLIFDKREPVTTVTTETTKTTERG